MEEVEFGEEKKENNEFRTFSQYKKAATNLNIKSGSQEFSYLNQTG